MVHLVLEYGASVASMMNGEALSRTEAPATMRSPQPGSPFRKHALIIIPYGTVIRPVK